MQSELGRFKNPVRPIKLRVDCHVATGKSQGSKTTIRAYIEAISRMTNVSAFFYADWPSGIVSDRRLKMPDLGSLFRLLCFFPFTELLNPRDVFVYQYIAPPLPFAKRILIIHDILPFTHPQLFGRTFGLRFWVLTGWSIRSARAVITVSQYSKCQIETRFPFARGRVHVVPNPPSFELGQYSAMTLQDDGVLARRGLQAGSYALAVGRLERRKNFQMLADAYATPELSHQTLVIVGREDGAFSLSLPSNVLHLRDVSDDELAALYRGCCLVLYPSLAEGFGIPLLDALLFGKPVLSAGGTALDELSQYGATKLPVDGTTAPQDWARRIQEHFAGRPVPPPPATQVRKLREKFSGKGLFVALSAAVSSVGTA